MSALRKIPVLLLLLAALPSFAIRPELPSVPAVPKVSSLTGSSGYVFTGTVKSVQFDRGQSGTIATMRITFQVDQGIRGVRTGQVLTIREWIGLWQAGERYRPGERVALFLYPPSKLGLTSPVGGSNGRYPVDNNGRIVVKPGRAPILPGHETATTPIFINPRDLIPVFGGREE